MDENVSLDKKHLIAVEKAIAKFAYGDLIRKQWLLNAFEIKEPTTGTRKDFETFCFKFMDEFEAFRQILLQEHKMFLVSERGTGYRIAHPNTQSDIAMTRLKTSVKKEINKAINTLTHINENMLTDNEIKRRDEQMGKIAALNAFTRKKQLTHNAN